MLSSYLEKRMLIYISFWSISAAKKAQNTAYSLLAVPYLISMYRETFNKSS